MILIITHKKDYTADYIINILNQRKINYKRLNCEDIFLSEFSIKIDGSFGYSFLGETAYKSIWFRRTKLPEVKDLSEDEEKYILNETESLFENIFSILPGKWLSAPRSVYNAENKLLQLKIAKDIGFNLPPTLVTNSRSELRQFYIENNKDIIIKPISGMRISSNEHQSFIFTNQIPSHIIHNLEEFELTPSIIQKNIYKEYEIRVTVVNQNVFAAAVYSQADNETKFDWRRKKLKFIPINLPIEIENLCVQLLKKLNLSFGAIDLIKTPDGNYFFLEINPNGQWVWIETQTGQKISEAIINFLIEE